MEVMDILQLNAMNGRPPGQVNQPTMLPQFCHLPPDNQRANPSGISPKTGIATHNVPDGVSEGTLSTPIGNHGLRMDTSSVGTSGSLTPSESSVNKVHPPVSFSNIETSKCTPQVTAAMSHTPSVSAPQFSCIDTGETSHVQSSPHRQDDKPGISDPETMDTFPSPLGIDFDPFDILKNTLNLEDLDSEVLDRSGIVDINSHDVADMVTEVQNVSNQVFTGRMNPDSGHSSVDSSEECLSGRVENSTSSSFVEIADFSPEWSYPEVKYFLEIFISKCMDVI